MTVMGPPGALGRILGHQCLPRHLQANPDLALSTTHMELRAFRPAGSKVQTKFTGNVRHQQRPLWDVRNLSSVQAHSFQKGSK